MHRAPATPPEARNGRTGEPNRRALDAMASAARRARGPHAPQLDAGDEETGARRLVARSTTSGGRRPGTGGARLAAPVAPPSAPVAGRRAAGPAPVVRATSRTEWWTRWRLDPRRTRAFLAAAAVGILVIGGAGIVLGLALRSPARPLTSRTGAVRRPTTSRGSTGPQTGTHAAKSGKSGKPAPGATGGRASPTTTTAPSPAAATATPGGPRLSSVSPSSGGAGQSVVVNGTGLVSSNGEVVAYFGGAAAPTSCGTQTSCTVSVPDLGSGPASVALTIVTAGGRSNSLRFSYR